MGSRIIPLTGRRVSLGERSRGGHTPVGPRSGCVDRGQIWTLPMPAIVPAASRGRGSGRKNIAGRWRRPGSGLHPSRGDCSGPLARPPGETTASPDPRAPGLEILSAAALSPRAAEPIRAIRRAPGAPFRPPDAWRCTDLCQSPPDAAADPGEPGAVSKSWHDTCHLSLLPGPVQHSRDVTTRRLSRLSGGDCACVARVAWAPAAGGTDHRRRRSVYAAKKAGSIGRPPDGWVRNTRRGVGAATKNTATVRGGDGRRS